MKKLLISVAVFAFAIASFAQAPGYEFTTVVSHKATPVKDQSSTGTCWCFATASFMESELLRMGKGEYDLSEMFIVRQKYMNQMEDNYLRRGKDFGLLAYNDIPSYEVIDEGITSLSIDWEMVGNEAANFVLNNVPIQKYMPTEVRLRKSL